MRAMVLPQYGISVATYALNLKQSLEAAAHSNVTFPYSDFYSSCSQSAPVVDDAVASSFLTLSRYAGLHEQMFSSATFFLQWQRNDSLTYLMELV